jgi:EF-P beta-lysylation protein EpmB
MSPGDPHDPLLLQVLARNFEVAAPEFPTSLDPVGDLAAMRLPGLIQKYKGRALLIASGACAVHCRYCFRRSFPYETAPKGVKGWQTAIDEIHRNSGLEEIILSGGDPLTVTDHQLQWLINQLNKCQHVQRIRIHTRMPVVIPQRICDELLQWVSESRAAVYFVLHINHVREIDNALEERLAQLIRSGATLLNQSVLLRGINDCPETQLDLCRKLVNIRVLPYYLHQLDRASGTTHFETSIQLGHEVIEHLRRNLPGYAVPKYVREIAGEESKTPL